MIKVGRYAIHCFFFSFFIEISSRRVNRRGAKHDEKSRFRTLCRVAIFGRRGGDKKTVIIRYFVIIENGVVCRRTGRRGCARAAIPAGRPARGTAVGRRYASSGTVDRRRRSTIESSDETSDGNPRGPFICSGPAFPSALSSSRPATNVHKVSRPPRVLRTKQITENDGPRAIYRNEIGSFVCFVVCFYLSTPSLFRRRKRVDGDDGAARPFVYAAGRVGTVVVDRRRTYNITRV